MKKGPFLKLVLALSLATLFSGCASVSQEATQTPIPPPSSPIVAGDSSLSMSGEDYASRLPAHIDTHGEKTILVDPNVHAWGAYGADGYLIRAGLAASGANWCHDTGRPCRTSTGSFRITSLGGADCKSSIYPKPKGGGPMPYCMFFHGSMALHGSPMMADANISHGCVRIPVSDAEWIRYNFANVGTRIIIKPYIS
ncbi:MAG: L,D-transpeptidase [Gammaproteobacteria bacterium]|nr:L,D-transpeptidase [Gammaproteobacteria bacterium]